MFQFYWRTGKYSSPFQAGNKIDVQYEFRYNSINFMEESSKKQQILQDLKKFILSKTSIVYIQSDEEDRVEGLLKELSATFQPKPKLFIWSPFHGLTGENEKIENSKNPVEALDKVIQSPEQALYLFEGLHPFLNTDLSLPRKLKDLHRSLRNRYATVFILAPVLVVPEELKRDMVVYELPMPDAIGSGANPDGSIVSASPQASKLTESLTPELKDRMVKAALGLSLDQVARAFRSALIGRTTIDSSLIDAVLEEKGQLIKKSGILNLVTRRPALEDIGGLENLKDWLKKRSKVLSNEGKSFGLQLPKGVLITGLSGCGKSLCAKAFASFWQVPLLHLDMAGSMTEPLECRKRLYRFPFGRRNLSHPVFSGSMKSRQASAFKAKKPEEGLNLGSLLPFSPGCRKRAFSSLSLRQPM